MATSRGRWAKATSNPAGSVATASVTNVTIAIAGAPLITAQTVKTSDEDTVALLRACRSARDCLIVVLMARARLRRGEVCGLRRRDVHALVDSRPLRCEVEGPMCTWPGVTT